MIFPITDRVIMEAQNNLQESVSFKPRISILGQQSFLAFVVMSCHLYSKRGVLLPGKVDLPLVLKLKSLFLIFFVPHFTLCSPLRVS